jgi:hypothetical protein
MNKIKTHEHFRANNWSNLSAAREARAIGDKKRTAASLALVDEYEKKHRILTDPATIAKRKAKDADLAKGMSQKAIDARNETARAQAAAHIKKKLRAEAAGVKVNDLKSVELMLAEEDGIFITALWRKLKMPDEALTKGC